MIAGPMTLAALLIAAAPIEQVVLTPDTMAEHEFFIECRAWEISEPTLAQGRSAAVGVLVRFDPEEGPAIKEFHHDGIANATLVLRDGEDVVMSTPVQIVPWSGNDGGHAIDFTIQPRLLEGAELILESNTSTFIVDVSSFCEWR